MKTLQTATDGAATFTGRAVGLWSGVRTGARRVWQVFRQELQQRPGESVSAYRRRMMLFFGPLLLLLLGYGLPGPILVVGWGEAGWKYYSIFLSVQWLYIIPPAGKESLIPLLVESHIHPALAAASIVFADCVMAFFVAYNFSYIRRLPIADRFVAAFLEQGRRLLRQRPWVRNFSFLGLVFFVMIPFYGSGAVGGTVLGMILGLSRLGTWLAILFGSTIGCFSLAYGASTAKAFLAQLSYGGTVTVTFFLGLILYYIFRTRQS